MAKAVRVKYFGYRNLINIPKRLDLGLQKGDLIAFYDIGSDKRVLIEANKFIDEIEKNLYLSRLEDDV